MSASSRSSLAGKRGEMTATALALAIAIGAGSGAAPAQQSAENPPAAWRVECTGDGKTLDCRAVQQVFHRETRQLLVSVAVRPAADGKSGAMLMTLSLGLNLTEPVLVKVDNGTPERQAIQTCTNVGCFAAMTLSDKLIAAMRTASELKITVQDANKKPIEMSLPLLGFGLAFDKAK
jgi:invasion protein IalB